MIRALVAIFSLLALRQQTHTTGTARLRNTLQDMILKHAPDRDWGQRGQIVADDAGKRGLLLAGDVGVFPNGSWAWLKPLSIDPHDFSATLTPLVTQPTGSPPHTHLYTMPLELQGPQIGDQVYAIWLDSGGQQPLVIGKVEWSHD